MLRAIAKTNGRVIIAFRDEVMKKISQARDKSSGSDLGSVCDAVEKGLGETLEFLQNAANEKPEYLEISARNLAYSLARVYAG